MGDDEKLILGLGSDLQIYHSGTDSFINNDTGDLYLKNFANDKDIIFQSDDGSGGVTEYFRLDGNNTNMVASKTIVFTDNAKASFGASEDLKIKHDGTNSFIINETGNLKITQNADDGDIVFQSDNGSGSLATYFALDGGITRTVVYKNFNFQDNVKLEMGTGADLQIYHDGSNSYIDDVGTGWIKIRGNGGVLLESYSEGETMLKASRNGAVELYYDNSKKFETTSTGVTVTGYLTATDSLLATNAVVIGTDSTPEQVSIFEGSTNEMWFQQSTSGGSVVFQTDNFIINGHNGNETQFTSTKDGSVDLYYDNSKKLETTSDGVLVSGFLESKKADTGAGYNDGIARFVNETTATSGGSSVINVRNTYGIGFGGLIKFWSTSTATSIGNISFNSSRTAVNYNTGSDYRLKEDYRDFNALDLTSKIKVYDFKWKNVNDRSYGVIAHELDEIVPSVVSGDKDGEEMQSVDYSKLVPVLIKSIQELEARLAALEN